MPSNSMCLQPLSFYYESKEITQKKRKKKCIISLTVNFMKKVHIPKHAELNVLSDMLYEFFFVSSINIA